MYSCTLQLSEEVSGRGGISIVRPIPTLSDDELSSDSDSDGEPDMPGGKAM